MPEAAHRRRSSHRHHWLIGAVIVALCALAAATTALVATRVSPSPAAATPTAAPGRLSVVASQPAPDATAVPSETALSVRFSVPLAEASPVPSLTPAVAGSWVHTAPDVLAFDAAAPLPPGGTMSVSVPGGPNGIEGSGGQRLADTLTTHFTVAPMTTLRLQQLLAT